MKRATKSPKRSAAPDPTVTRVIEQLTPILNAWLDREAAASHLRAQVAARELDLRSKELDLRFNEHALAVAEHEMRAQERAQDLVERRLRLDERRAALDAQRAAAQDDDPAVTMAGDHDVVNA